MAEQTNPTPQNQNLRDDKLGAAQRPSGGPDTDFDMETDGQEARADNPGVVNGVISNPAQSGPLGSGPVNIGPGTDGGSHSINTSGTADTIGDTTTQSYSTERTGVAGNSDLNSDTENSTQPITPGIPDNGVEPTPRVGQAPPRQTGA